MYKYVIETNFVNLELSKAWANKTGSNIIVFNFVDIIQCDTCFFSIA